MDHPGHSSIDDAKIEEILLSQHYISQEALDAARISAQERKISIIEELLIQKAINKDLLGQAIAESLGVPYIDLNSNEPSRESVIKIPEEISREYSVVVFGEDDKSVIVTSSDPLRPDLIDKLQSIFGDKKISVSYSLPEDIEETFLYYRESLQEKIDKLISEGLKDLTKKIFDAIVDYAQAYHASDVHFEPRKDTVYVRFRVDGVLIQASVFPRSYYDGVMSEVKSLAKLDVTDKDGFQDGAIRYIYGNKSVNMRVSVVPTLDGEKAVLRIISEYVGSVVLRELGLSQSDHKLLEKAARKPFGMILVTGPAGSGKTTTLYAALEMIRSQEINIMTIEDPVEYRIPDINQIQIGPNREMTLTEGLRSIVRQDPDVILVGEIRDPDTAEVATNAALAGNLLFSTFHANDAATVIVRLLDMKVEPFLLASTLELIMSQRLIRKLCESCRHSTSMNREQLNEKLHDSGRFFEHDPVTLYTSSGCANCGHSGFKGRVGIFETIVVTPAMKDLIAQRPSVSDIWKVARGSGSRTLFEDGIEKVKTGVTTLDELLRLAAPPRE